MFELPRYVVNRGEVVVDDGEVRSNSEGKLLHVAPEFDLYMIPDIQSWFEDHYTIQFRNYPVGQDYLTNPELVPTTL